jgi:predicted RNA-binding Zn ribbon-like protein
MGSGSAGKEKRQGGRRSAPARYLFEVTGGDLCLDLANTVDSRPSATPKERLGSYADLLSWGGQAGAITSAEAARLAAAAGRRPAAAASALRRARDLREALFGIFSVLARGGVPGEADLAILNAGLGRAMARARLIADAGPRGPARQGPGGGRVAAGRAARTLYRWGWATSGEDLEQVLWPAIRSAAGLLTSDRLSRVRECAAGSCAWLFLDTSRNRSRRWCDMTVCGNREKAQRHYRRIRRAE